MTRERLRINYPINLCTMPGNNNRRAVLVVGTGFGAGFVYFVFCRKVCVPGTKLIQTPESLPVSGMYFFCQYQEIVILKHLTNYKSNLQTFKKVIFEKLKITLALEITIVFSENYKLLFDKCVFLMI